MRREVDCPRHQSFRGPCARPRPLVAWDPIDADVPKFEATAEPWIVERAKKGDPRNIFGRGLATFRRKIPALS